MTDDDLTHDLRALRDVSLDDESRASARLRAEREATAAFEAAHGRGSRPSLAGLSFSRLAVPAGLAAVVVVYLHWAIQAATALAQ